MKIEKIVLRKMKMQLKKPFHVSFGIIKEKKFIVAEVHTKDFIGYGDCSALPFPFYNEETTSTAWHILDEFLIPLILSKDEISHPEEVNSLFSPIRRNQMAKSALDCAIWDLYAKEQNISLSKALGGTKEKIETGISIGIQDSIDDLLHVIDKYMNEGYRRIKLKIKPGKDIKYLEAVREHFGDIMLMADANSAYTLKDIDLFKEMDKFNLLMIEQPLSHDDIVDHAKLQAVVDTRICLDESIHSIEDARKAIELGSMKTINIKVARVGGLTETKKIHDLCQLNGIPVWCGGMLDTGIARAHNIAVASLPNYQFPGDIPASNRYWDNDFVSPQVIIDQNSLVQVPNTAGIGFEPALELYDKYTIEKKEFVKS
ncbi:o-succinylbenzoate synthase [Cytobacillus depressus]|uniref:o-succinylbenzoate synthase n=1 Tax=Cytobacillus depressus TaxID=1602942 RepID=A0A6L3VB95_9BACI|nr:o-succinylbenzoate synthase [Cytobacillus depressus]KAB2338043.1 o-succinylbenzoate synthase [Cytobacillus depressus]